MSRAAPIVAPRSHAPGALELARRRRPDRGAAPRERPQRAEDAFPDIDADEDPGTPGPRLRSPFRRPTRRHAAFAAGGLAAGWIALVIAGAVGDSSAVNERAASLREENAALTERLEATRREVELVQSEAYINLEARAYGLGRGRERTFTLGRDAPPPPPLPLLGAEPGEGKAASPLEDWLELLLGR